MSAACPLLFRQVDGTVSRISALFVSVGVIAYFLSGSLFFLLFLAADFMIRLYGDKKKSPVFLASLGLQKLLHLPQKMVDAGAKRMAAKFGLLFVFLLIISHVINAPMLAYGIAATFLLCTFMEIVFSFCVGCQVYFLIKKIYPDFEV